MPPEMLKFPDTVANTSAGFVTGHDTYGVSPSHIDVRKLFYKLIKDSGGILAGTCPQTGHRWW